MFLSQYKLHDKSPTLKSAFRIKVRLRMLFSTQLILMIARPGEQIRLCKLAWLIFNIKLAERKGYLKVLVQLNMFPISIDIRKKDLQSPSRTDLVGLHCKICSTARAIGL